MSGNLLIGYGNPGRGDDGLGPAFARRMAARELPALRVEIDYQLTVEHALMISAARTVVFVDAALDAAPRLPAVPPLPMAATWVKVVVELLVVLLPPKMEVTPV